MSLRGNSIYVSAGAAVRTVVAVASAPLLIRMIGLERFGIWTVLNSTVAIVAIGELGISVAITNCLAAANATKDREASVRLLGSSFLLASVLGVVASVAFWLGVPWLHAHFFPGKAGTAESLASFLVLPMVLAPRFWQMWAAGVEAAAERFDVQMIIETVSAVGIQAGAVVVAYAGGGLKEMSFFLAAATLATALVHFGAVGRLFGSFFGAGSLLGIAETRGLLRFGVTNSVANLGSVLFAQADRIIVNAVLGPAAAGIYGASASLVSKINELSSLPLRVLPPAIAAAESLSNRMRTCHIFLQGTRLNSLIVGWMACSLLFWARPLATLSVGSLPAFEMTPVLTIMGLIYGIYSLNAAPYWTAIGLGQPAINARWALAGSALMLCLIGPLSVRFGLRGAAVANAGYIATLLINAEVVRRLNMGALKYISVAGRPVAAFLVSLAAPLALSAARVPVWWQAALFLLLLAGFTCWVAGSEFRRGLSGLRALRSARLLPSNEVRNVA